MVSDTAERLGEIMDLMRAKGATRVKVDGLEVELGPAPGAFAVPATASASGWPVETAEKCPCGCPLAEHGDHGLCLNGCAEEKCCPAAEVEKA